MYLSIKAYSKNSFFDLYKKIGGQKSSFNKEVIFDQIIFENNQVTFYSNLTILFNGIITENISNLINIIIDDELYVGSDEVGVGESIGPIVACSLKFLNYESKKKVIMNGIKDSKKLSAKEVESKAEFIKKHSEYYVAIIEPYKFNEIYKKLNNVKAINALMQNQLHKKFEGKGFKHITDQFVNKNKYDEYIRESDNVPFDGELLLLTKAEEKYLEVSAAAIISKSIYNNWVIEKLKDEGINYKIKNKLNAWDIFKKIDSGEYCVKDKDLFIKRWKN